MIRVPVERLALVSDLSHSEAARSLRQTFTVNASTELTCETQP